MRSNKSIATSTLHQNLNQLLKSTKLVEQTPSQDVDRQQQWAIAYNRMKSRSIRLTPKIPMKTTIEIDNSLITNALQVTGLTAQQEVIELALNLLIQMKNQQNLRALRGKLAWEGDLDRMRTDTEQY